MHDTFASSGDPLSTTAELAELHDLIGGLLRCVSTLKARYGDNPAMCRIVIDADRILGDVELLDTDVSEIDLMHATVQQSGEKTPFPTPMTTATFGVTSTLKESVVTTGRNFRPAEIL